MLMRVVIIWEMLAIHILHTSWAFLLTHTYCGASILRHCHTNNRSNRLSQSWATFPKEHAEQMHFLHYLKHKRSVSPIATSSTPSDCMRYVTYTHTHQAWILMTSAYVTASFLKLEVWKSWIHSKWASLFRFSGFHVLYRVSLWSPP